MWINHMDLHPGASFAPDLYGLGDSIETWAEAVLQMVPHERLIVVGCSVGGSCAIEVARRAPDRVAAVVLMGTKPDHRPDPEYRRSAIHLLQRDGIDAAWSTFWAPLFGASAHPEIIQRARCSALTQHPDDLIRGISVFHSRPSRGATVRQLNVPIIVMSGVEDVAPGVEYSACLARTVRNGTFHDVPSCGHYLPLEQPSVLREVLTGVVATELAHD